ncbi:MAG TPA: hypothetical protein VF521_09600 [Pyrinomonadaceae bacterium]
MTPSTSGRAARRLAPAALPTVLSAAAALILSPTFPGASLAAQSMAGDTTVSAPRAGSASVGASTVTQEIYVAAFRSSARQWCASGGATALDDALASTRSIVRASVAEVERPGVERALDGAYGELARAGGCPALVRPASVVVVDRFEGHAWNAPRRKVAPRDRGARTEEGYTVVTRKTKVGKRRSRRVAGEADFTFTTQREELVRGRYRVPANGRTVAERWAVLESTIAEQYPTLRVVRSLATPRGEASYAARDVGDVRDWSTRFVNPDTQALEVRMFAMPAGGRGGAEWVIVADYVGFGGR